MKFNDEDKKEATFFVSSDHSNIDGHIIETYLKLKSLHDTIDFDKIHSFKLRMENGREICTPLKMTIIGELGTEREVIINYDGSITTSWFSKSIDDIYEKGEWAMFDGKTLVYEEDIVKINPLNQNNPFRLASITYQYDGVRVSEPNSINYTTDIDYDNGKSL